MKILFEEKFVTELDPNWVWVHEAPSAWEIADGALHLRTLPGSLWGDSNNAYNFLLRSVESFIDGLAARVTVTNTPQVMGEQAGLIWYHDDDNYIKFVKESLNGEEWIVLAREEGGQPELINKTRISAESAELQLVLMGGKVQGKFRTSSEDNWQTVGKCAIVQEADPQVGLFTHGCPAEIERWVELREFSILKIE